MIAGKMPSWLKKAVFYEIYPQSFLDTNKDGIGDIKGIIKKLHYIRSLGCNAIWLNPCFESPFQDAGYDISDFYKVAHRYGTNKDLKNLFYRAKKQGIRIILDLVLGHTSTEHPWFKASCSAKKNFYSNRYIWTNSVWEDAGGGLKSIQGYAERDGNYITNFFHFQPALNYGFTNPDPKRSWQLSTKHPDVVRTKEEIKKIMRFWLDMGASGFRVDLAGLLVKNDPDYEATMVFWQEIRRMLDKEYPEAVLVSEWGNPLKSLSAGFHMDFTLHGGDFSDMYNSLFRKGEQSFFHEKGAGNIKKFIQPFTACYENTKKIGYISFVSGNHDMLRLSYRKNRRTLKSAFVLILSMPGAPYIYYGDEIGMNYQEQLVSKEGGYERTGSRTPMQWKKGKNAGFSQAQAKKLYLPIEKGKYIPNVESQEKDPDSLLNTVRKLIRIRQQYPALQADGDFSVLYAEENKYPFVYVRSMGNERILVALNPSGMNKTVSIKASDIKEISLILQDNVQSIEIKKGMLNIKMKKFSFGLWCINPQTLKK